MLMYLTIKSAFSIEFDNQILNKRFTEKKKKKIFQYVNKDLIRMKIWNSVLMDRRSVMLLFTCTSEDMLEGKGGARERQGARASEVVVVLVFVKHGDEGTIYLFPSSPTYTGKHHPDRFWSPLSNFS